MTSRAVVIVVFDGFQSLDATGPFEVFAGAEAVARAAASSGESSVGNPEDPIVADDPVAYRLVLASVQGGIVRAESGLGVDTEPLSTVDALAAIDTLVVAGGDGVQAARQQSELVGWVAATAKRARRVASVCSGAFLLAEAGLLDGRRATTHWARAGQLARDFPLIEVDVDPIYLCDGTVWTSAGVTAGIDLALALVADDLGAATAQTVARWLVMFLHRPGGQSQFAVPVWTPRAERSPIRAVQNLVDASPGGDHRVPVLAAAAAMSERHFARVFREEIGVSPGRYVEKIRVEAARRELEERDDTLDVIALRCGFGTAETLRRSFRRHVGVAPDRYRRRFRTPAAGIPDPSTTHEQETT